MATPVILDLAATYTSKGRTITVGEALTFLANLGKNHNDAVCVAALRYMALKKDAARVADDKPASRIYTPRIVTPETAGAVEALRALKPVPAKPAPSPARDLEAELARVMAENAALKAPKPEKKEPAKPEAPKAKPEAPKAKPEAPAAKPEAPAAKPEAPAAKPEKKEPAKPEHHLAGTAEGFDTGSIVSWFRQNPQAKAMDYPVKGIARNRLTACHKASKVPQA